MADRITRGLDMSMSKSKTAAVALRWRPDGARVVAFTIHWRLRTSPR